MKQEEINHCSCHERSWYGEDHDSQCQGERRLYDAAPDMLEALAGLQRELREHIKFDVKKHYSLMLYDAAATKAIARAKGESI